MTPIEKASKLTSYYLPFCNDNITDAKYCALIAVDEIIQGYEFDSLDIEHKRIMDNINYWDEVKQEINNL